MKRIDSINARPNVNGTGKTGFHDNADLSGQDATYLTPSWLNQVQEELCNLLEMNGIALNSGVRDQLYQLLATNADIDALAAATQVKLDQEQTWRTDADNWLQQQINNEQTARINAISQEQTWRENADADLENRKFDKAGGTITGNALITGDLTVQTSLLLGSFTAATNCYTPLPNGFLMQFGFIAYSDMTPISASKTGERIFDLEFPVAFPNHCISVTTTVCIERSGGNLDHGNDTWAQVGSVTPTGAAVFNQTGNRNSGTQQPFKGIYWQAFGY